MAVNFIPTDPALLHPISGLHIGVAEAGVRKANRKDLSVVLLDAGASVHGVFTNNRFCAAPVQLCRDHLQRGLGIRAMLINTGNANAGTGEDGLARARQTCVALAKQLNIAPEQILECGQPRIDFLIQNADPENVSGRRKRFLAAHGIPSTPGESVNLEFHKQGARTGRGRKKRKEVERKRREEAGKRRQVKSLAGIL